jgi:4-amino-4-deoxy-L-arabinose transferase-like glycosyltransferase
VTVPGAAEIDDVLPASEVADAARRFALRLALVVLAAFVLRLAYFWFSRKGVCDFTYPGDLRIHRRCPGDSVVYHHGANLLAEGRGFIVPTNYFLSAGTTLKAGADHPPLFTLLLAGVSWLGLDSWSWHGVVTVLIGTATVGVSGLFVRDLFGPRAGLLAAAFVGAYPFMWMNDGVVLSEGLSILLVVLVTWAAYRFWRAPGWRPAVWLGLACGAGILTRAEAGLFLPLMVVPMIVWSRTTWRARFGNAVVVGLAAIVVVAPWVAHNLERFNQTTTLSTGFGITLANSNCDDTYYGGGLGYWSFRCIGPVPKDPGLDQSDDEKFLRKKGMDYITSHTSRLPVVILAREGRVWNVFRVGQNARADVGEGRPLWATRLGLGVYYPIMALASVGVLSVRRARRVPVLPLVVPLVIVAITTAMTFGQARYRTTAEASIAILAALGVEFLWHRRRRSEPV